MGHPWEWVGDMGGLCECGRCMCGAEVCYIAFVSLGPTATAEVKKACTCAGGARDVFQHGCSLNFDHWHARPRHQVETLAVNK